MRLFDCIGSSKIAYRSTTEKFSSTVTSIKFKRMGKNRKARWIVLFSAGIKTGSDINGLLLAI